ncbi:MAG: serine protease [Bacillaceae bacterium]|nr:serine protease [Bacillaceae bacterium]
MGYYDDFDGYTQPRRQRGLGSVFFISVVSAIIGGIIVLLLVPSLIRSGILPGYETSVPPAVQQDEQAMDSPSDQVVNQNMNVSVNTAITEAVEKVENAVVGVIKMGEQVDFFSNRSRTVEQGTGSGVIFKKEKGKAYIVTNYHVIDGATSVEVSLPNGDRVPAEVIGTDVLTDLAVIAIEDDGVDTVAEFGTSSSLKVGEPAIAIGNPLGLEFSRTVTQGIISSLDRTVPVDLNKDGSPEWELDVIQTDAAINPGNSGGALINISGQVIGINSLKISQTGVEGLGFAIPSDDVVQIIEDLTRYGEVIRPFLGIEPLDLRQVPSRYWKDPLQIPENVHQGVVVYNVERFSPADKGGIKKYDVIVAMDGQPIASSADLRKYMYSQKDEGDTVEVTVYRQGEKMTLTVQLVERSPQSE